MSCSGYSFTVAFDSSLAFARRRACIPRIGTWISRDLLGPADGPNLMLYCKSNPVKWLDYTGLKSIRPGDGTPLPGFATLQQTSDWWCCLKAQLLGLSDGNWGGVVCCDGRKVVCNWRPDEGGGANPDPTLKWCDKNLYDKCIREHEEIHKADCACEQTAPGSVSRCAIPPDKHLDSELRGHAREMECIAGVDCSASPDPSRCGEVKKKYHAETLVEYLKYLLNPLNSHATARP
ncbi:MAG: hypothetical protein IPK67_18360 [Planctomycetes bacterium]|nr:hypothetical protein [Planctomycetota bacterium]